MVYVEISPWSARETQQEYLRSMNLRMSRVFKPYLFEKSKNCFCPGLQLNGTLKFFDVQFAKSEGGLVLRPARV